MTTFGLLAALIAGAALPQAPQSAIDAARAGGHLLVCRHATTDNAREREPLDYQNPSTQRRLSAQGERQAREMGDGFRALGIEFVEVVASPVERAYRTAQLIAGRDVRRDSIWHTNGGAYTGPAERERTRKLSTPVGVGTILIVSHIGTIQSVIPEARGVMEEGDCAVVRPNRESHTVIGIVHANAWLGNGRSHEAPPKGRDAPGARSAQQGYRRR